MEGTFKPLGDRILVRPLEDSESKTKTGIILSEAATRGTKVFGEVVSTGTGIFSQNGNRIPITVQVGDTVMYKKDMSGDETEIEGEKYLLFNEHELLGYIRK